MEVKIIVVICTEGLTELEVGAAPDRVWSPPRFNCLALLEEMAVLVFRALSCNVKHPMKKFYL